jgi:aminopeptidase N
MADFTARFLSDYNEPHYKISTIDLTFELADNETLVTSVMSITRTSNKPCPLVLDGEQLALVSVAINQQALSSEQYILRDSSLEILPNEREFILTIVTKINPLDNTSLEGLFKSGDAYCTQCEAEGFRRITYYLDRPDVMAVFSTKIIADKQQFPYLLSNGNKVESGELDNGQHFVKWQDPFPKPCYLFALVAGDFDLLSDSYTTISDRKVALEIFVDRGNRSKAEHAMESLKRSMKWDEDTFDLEYDLDIYMIVAVDFFNMGAMENKGLNVFNSKYVLADKNTATDTDYFNVEAVIAHEYFHNWTGNRVTCRDWFQLSLKEGLTVFRDQQFSADMHSAAVTRIQNVRVLRSMQFAEDASPMAHPIRPEKVVEMNNFYTLTVYEKGAEVIRMLHTLLGQDKFKLGLALYFKRFDGMAVTCDDFVNAMSDASAIDLSQFKRWYSQVGTPLLTVKESFDASSGTFTLSVQQQASGVNGKIHGDLHIPLNIELITQPNKANSSATENQQHLLELKSGEQKWTFENFSTKPTLAFLGDLSAPVKVNFNQTDDDLEMIMVQARDEFCRWDAGQKLLTTYIKILMQSPSTTLPQRLISAFNNILLSNIDDALKAEQLTLPAFDEIADSIEAVDPGVLLDAISRLKYFLASGLQVSLNEVYEQCQATLAEVSDSNDVGLRSLKNTCLSYLSLLPEHQALVNVQYTSSDNMTDTLMALNFSAKNNLSEFDQQMGDFEQKWQDTALVMDKWFTINALLSNDDIYQHLDTLLSHKLFSLKNPNRARSLVGAFTSNHKYFHCSSGRGYQFLAKQIALLNEINPQVASRLITPLIQFKGFDKARQMLIRIELEKLSQLPTLSNDLKEKLDAALI